MPSTVRPASRAAPTSFSTISRRTATTTTRVRSWPAALLTVAERLPVEHGLVHRHRDVIGRLHLDGGGERLLVLERRQVERAHDDPLVGDAQAHARGKPVLGEERLQRLRESGDVGDLAVAQDAGAKGGDGAALERHRAVGGDLGRGDVAGIEVEADDRGLGGGALLEHVRGIGREVART